MSTALAQLLKVRSQFAEEVIAYCDSAIERLDKTGFSYRTLDGGSEPVTISKTAIDARVFTVKRERPEKEEREESREEADLPPQEKALADLNENPWLAEQRETEPWSRVFSKALPGRPLVIRGAPGGGKTTLSRHSALQRLLATRDALKESAALVENTEPMLWTTCTALAACENRQDPPDLVVDASFEALKMPLNGLARSNRFRAWLRSRIMSGNCPVALDSLDEVEQKDLPAFSDRAPRLLDLPSPLVLTCRVVEWEQRRGHTGWNGREQGPYELAPLDTREQQSYLKRFFEEGVKQPAKREEMRRALQSSLALRRTCESPLLLFFACLLHVDGELGGAVRRTELYQRMRRRLFLGEWKGLSNPPEWADGDDRESSVTDWIAEIALDLFRSAPDTKTFRLSEWNAAVKSSGAQAAAEKVFPVVHPKQLLKDLQRIGLLLSAGWGAGDEPQYSFPHRSFLAYFAGKALAKRYNGGGREELIDHLWFQPAWEDVILFAAGCLREADVDNLLQEIENLPEDIFLQRLRWQWRIAGEAISLPEGRGASWKDTVRDLFYKGGLLSLRKRDNLLEALSGAIRTIPDAVDGILQAIEPDFEPDESVRSDAAKVLGLVGGERAEEALLRALDPTREPDSFVRNAVACALGMIGGKRAEDALLRAFAQDRSGTHPHVIAIGILGQIVGSRAEDALLRAIDPDSESHAGWRESAVIGLGQVGGKRAEDALLRAIDPDREPIWEVRMWAVQSLGLIGGERVRDALLTAIDPAREPEGDVRHEVITALGLIGGAHVVDAFIQSINPGHEPDKFTRMRAAIELGKIGGERAVDALLRCIDPASESVEDVRRNALFALGMIGGKRSEAALLQAVDTDRESSENVRGSAALALGMIGGKRAEDALLQAIDTNRESSEKVRGSAALALGMIGGKRAEDALLQAIDTDLESSEKVRGSAARALGAISGERVEAALLWCIDPDCESNERMRMNAVFALGDIGGEHAVDALLRNLMWDFGLARVIFESLRNIYWRLGNRELFRLGASS